MSQPTTLNVKISIYFVEQIQNMTRTPHIQHNATSLILPAVRTVACSCERESFGCKPCTVRNMLYYKGFKALPSQGRAKPRQNAEVGRGFFGGRLELAPVDPVGEGVEALYENHTEIAQHLGHLLQKFANCYPEPEVTAYIDIDPYLASIKDLLNENQPEENRFFYHPDHLGSSSFITDADGEGYQHLQYLPFGETSVSQKISWWSTPYQFTGKEKDAETGYNYFGARYYNSDLSIWLSVDAFLGKHPSLTPYNYCANNPIKYIDINGDTIFVNRRGYVINAQRNGEGNLVDNLVYMRNNKGGYDKIGEIGGEINANGWFKKLLRTNSSNAYLMGIFNFYNAIREDGIWDYKYRYQERIVDENKKMSEHIIGIAFNAGNTTFSFEGRKYRAEDLNNFHFGVIAKASKKFLSESLMLRMAGIAEQKKWKNSNDSKKPSQQELNHWCKTSYGDNPTDSRMIIDGFRYFDRNAQDIYLPSVLNSRFNVKQQH